MNNLLILGMAVTSLALLAGCWLGWELLRQNGRMLVRLDELEKRLDALEFGETEKPLGLPLNSPAPEFELPDLVGERRTLAQFRGQALLLIFFNPGCGYCRELTPKLKEKVESRKQKAETESPKPLLVIITTGGVQANRELLDQHQLTCPVLLQKEMEVATAYQANGTPSGYLISPEGNIASELAMGAEALLALADSKELHQINARPHPGPLPRGEGEATERLTRFGNRSLARSRLKRDGLKAGTPAPNFRLPRLDGSELALEDLRGRRVLLVFSSPHCGPCNTLAPELEKFYREQQRRKVPPSPRPSPPGEGESTPGVEVVMISRGEPKENRAKVKEHGLTFPVVLQQQWEISRRYAMFATPIAYLIDEGGVIAKEVAVGSDAILELMARAEQWVHESQEVARV